MLSHIDPRDIHCEVNATKEGTMILWDGIPKIMYHYNLQECREDLKLYRCENTKIRIIEWLEKRIITLEEYEAEKVLEQLITGDSDETTNGT